jgi:hypothetical protein
MCACSTGTELPTQVSGTWQRVQGEGIIEIKLAREPLSLTVAGNTYPATIQSIDKGSYSIHLNVETDPGHSEEWVLRQVWDDNGSNYTLSLNHNGTNEKLVSAQRS